MHKLIYTIFGYILTQQNTFADAGIFGGGGLDKDDIRRGDIHTDDIPGIIQGAIDFFINIAGSVAVIFIIIGAYQILFGSLEQDTTKGKNTIIMALMGFTIAALAWFIIKLIIDNLS